MKPVRDPLFVCIGEILWDVIGNQRCVGGAPFNFACHSAALGAKAALISRVSMDDLGSDLVHRARELNVETRGIQRCEEFPTGTVAAETQPDGTVDYVFPDECAWDHIRLNDASGELVDCASVICYGTLAQRSPETRSAIMAALSSAPVNAICFLDLNLRAPFYCMEVLTPSLSAAHTLKLCESEFSELKRLYGLGADDESAVKGLLDRFDLSVVVLTRGADGASGWTLEECAHVPGYAVTVADTIGCGDAFGAAFMTRLVGGASLKDALETANLVGAYVATQIGGTPYCNGEALQEFRCENVRT